MGWNREKFLKEAKILESLNHPNLVNFKNVCYQPLTIMFEYLSFSFSLLEQFMKLVDWMGLQDFSILFWLGRWRSSFFFKNKFRFDW